MSDYVTYNPWLGVDPNLRLSGTVYVEGTSTTIPGASVTLGSYSTTTNSWGYYAFDKILSGNYLLVVSKAGFPNYSTTIDVTTSITRDIFLSPESTTPVIVINGGAADTTNLNVTLTLSAPVMEGGVSQMRFANGGITWTDWEAYITSKSWTLSAGNGMKTVCVQFKDSAGNLSGIFSDTILLTGQSLKSLIDFNGDQKADLFWRHASSGQTAIWFMDGASYSSDSPGTVGDLNWQIKGMGDFDGDGKADVLWRDSATGWTAIWIMNGTTITAVEFPGLAGDLNWQIKGIGDFDGDGKADVFWQDSATGWTAIWIMNGTTITAVEFPGLVGDLNWQVKGIGDFDGNGKADVLWHNTSDGWTAIWFMNGATITSVEFPGQVSDPNWQIMN